MNGQSEPIRNYTEGLRFITIDEPEKAAAANVAAESLREVYGGVAVQSSE
jgi:hypothetical protein